MAQELLIHPDSNVLLADFLQSEAWANLVDKLRSPFVRPVITRLDISTGPGTLYPWTYYPEIHDPRDALLERPFLYSSPTLGWAKEPTSLRRFPRSDTYIPLNLVFTDASQSDPTMSVVREIIAVTAALIAGAEVRDPTLGDLETLGSAELRAGGLALPYLSVWSPKLIEDYNARNFDTRVNQILPETLTPANQHTQAIANQEAVLVHTYWSSDKSGIEQAASDHDHFARPFQAIKPETPTISMQYDHDLKLAAERFAHEFDLLDITPTSLPDLLTYIRSEQLAYDFRGSSGIMRAHDLNNAVIEAVIGYCGEVARDRYSLTYIFNDAGIPRASLTISPEFQLADVVIFMQLFSDLKSVIPDPTLRASHEQAMKVVVKEIDHLAKIQSAALWEVVKTHKADIGSLTDLLDFLAPVFGRPVSPQEILEILDQTEPGNIYKGEIIAKLKKTGDFKLKHSDKSYENDQEIAKHVVSLVWKLGCQDNLGEWLKANAEKTDLFTRHAELFDSYQTSKSLPSLSNFPQFETVVARYQTLLGTSGQHLPTLTTFFSFLDALTSAQIQITATQPEHVQKFWTTYIHMAKMWLPYALLSSLVKQNDVLSAYINNFWQARFNEIGLTMDQPHMWTPEVPNQPALDVYRAQLLVNAVLDWSTSSGLVTREQKTEILANEFAFAHLPTKFELTDESTRRQTVDAWVENLLASVNFPVTDHSNNPSRIWTSLPANRNLMRKHIQEGLGPAINLRMNKRDEQHRFIMEINDPEVFSAWFLKLAEMVKTPNHPTVSLLKDLGLDQLLWSDAGAALLAAAHNGILSPKTFEQAGLAGEMETVLYVLGLMQGLGQLSTIARERGFPVSFPDDGVVLSLLNYFPHHRVISDLSSLTSDTPLVPNDIQLIPGKPLILIGSAGAGKSTILKSLAMSAYSHKIGGQVFAQDPSSMPDFRYVVLSLNDDMAGYGSRFRHHVDRVAYFLDNTFSLNTGAGNVSPQILALMDEVFRGTEDNHAVAIIKAVLDTLSSNNVHSVLATHYGQLIDLHRMGKLPDLDIKSAKFGDYKLTGPLGSEYNRVLANKGFKPEFIDCFNTLVGGNLPDQLPVITRTPSQSAHVDIDGYGLLHDLDLLDKDGNITTGFAGLAMPKFPWQGQRDRNKFLSWLVAPLSMQDRKDLVKARGEFIDLAPDKEDVHGPDNLAILGRAITGKSYDVDLAGRFVELKDLESAYSRFKHDLSTVLMSDEPLSTHPLVQSYITVLQNAFKASSMPFNTSYAKRGKDTIDLITGLSTGLKQETGDNLPPVIAEYTRALKGAKDDATFGSLLVGQIENLLHLSNLSTWFHRDELTSCAVEAGEDLKITGGLYLGDRVISYLSERTVARVIPNDIEIPRTAASIATGDNESGKSFSAKMTAYNVFLALCTNHALAKSLVMPDYAYIATTFKASESSDKNSSSMHEAETVAQILKNVERLEADKRALVIFDEPGSTISSSEGAPFASLVILALQRAGVDIFATTHYHQLESKLHKLDPDLTIESYGYVYSEDDKSHFKAQKGQRPGTSRGVERAMDMVGKLVAEGKLNNPDQVLAVFEAANENLRLTELL